MQFIDTLFYFFASLTILACVAVVFSRNPIYSVLWLIFAFFNSAALFVLLKAELLAMLLVIVYVGAVAVLFLFVVMMLNIKTSVIKKSLQSYLPLGILLALVLAGELSVLIIHKNNQIPQKNLETTFKEAFKAETKDIKNSKREINKNTNAHQIGKILYTKYVLFFQISGLILFVAMIGAIVLTHRSRNGVRKQNISQQILRNKSAITMVKVETGKGI
jgi:NADH-quinone oxidoreductase subunit J